ncbi:hypothetical protein QWJ26_08615 [Streptomyces sp. CSDS2]|uniref:hypothetical protein n=1 Tax=Streptomyces sp. CSDS2 TaxID=3055051 RepID=UPI0025B17005|nr:hypothetical protein [Streptomyces sp. CSDS2]MDN3259870.1 hypothetical protein [Streptomyces sp. CSDS2]
MTIVRLGCGRAATLFYEPGGLLLRSCLIPTGPRHTEHMLTFQLGYLGAGEITVHVLLDGPGDGPRFTTTLLRGTDADDDGVDSYHHRVPGVWLTYATLPDTEVRCHYTVSGQPLDGDDLRGELVTEIAGALPVLTATTRAVATRRPLPEPARCQPVMDWNQANGSGSGQCLAATPPGADLTSARWAPSGTSARNRHASNPRGTGTGRLGRQ